MKTQEFTNDQLSELENFLKVCKTCNMKKINSSFLLYLVSKEGKENIINPYAKANNIVTEILCANGNCPIF